MNIWQECVSNYLTRLLEQFNFNTAISCHYKTCYSYGLWLIFLCLKWNKKKRGNLSRFIRKTYKDIFLVSYRADSLGFYLLDFWNIHLCCHHNTVAVKCDVVWAKSNQKMTFERLGCVFFFVFFSWKKELIHRPPFFTGATSAPEKQPLCENYWCWGLWIIPSNRALFLVIAVIFSLSLFSITLRDCIISNSFAFSLSFTLYFLLPEAFSKLAKKDLIYSKLRRKVQREH